jgi:(1->4)-alpha-D-glucan 1-alpha-D-glucosylmutase
VDYPRLARDLQGIAALYEGGWPKAEAWRELQAHPADARIKQLVTWRLLRLRRERSALFRNAGYVGLGVEGAAAEHALAFARIHEREAVLVVVARLTYTLCDGEVAAWSPQLWQGTRLRCSQEAAGLRRFRRWRNWLTGEALTLPGGDEPSLDMAGVFAGAGGLPFAVLVADADPGS